MLTNYFVVEVKGHTSTVFFYKFATYRSFNAKKKRTFKTGYIKYTYTIHFIIITTNLIYKFKCLI